MLKHLAAALIVETRKTRLLFNKFWLQQTHGNLAPHKIVAEVWAWIYRDH